MRVSRRGLVQLGASLAVVLGTGSLASCASLTLGAAPRGRRTDVLSEESRRDREPDVGNVHLARGFDTDFGHSGVPNQGWFNRRHAEGYEWFWTTGHTYWGGEARVWEDGRLALNSALDAGLKVAAYGRPVGRWREALANFGSVGRHLEFYALDVEFEPDGRAHRVTREMVDGVRAMGVRPVIYTARHMWHEIMAGSDEFGDVPLLDHAGTVSGWPSELASPNFGGWSKRIGQQLRLNVLKDGITIDENVIDRSFLRAEGEML